MTTPQPEKLAFLGGSKRFPHLPLVLEGIGIHHYQEHIDRPNGIGCWEWVQTRSGEGTLILNQKSYDVPVGSGILLRPDTPRIYSASKTPWIVNFLCFNGSMIHPFMDSIGLNNPGVYSLSHPQQILDQEDLMYTCYLKDQIQASHEISKQLYALLLDLSSDVKQTYSLGKSVQNDKVHAIICYLNDHYHQPISLQEIADHVGVTKEYLCLLFKKPQVSPY